MCTAAILAGGHGRRMGGRPKGLLTVGRTRIIDQQLTVLRAVADDVAIVVADEREAYEHLGVPLWTDVRPGCGPLGGILTALHHATTEVTVIVAADMPFVTADFLQHLAEAGADVDVAVPRTADGYQPLCAAYNKTCIDAIQRRLDAGRLKVTDLLPDVHIREIGSHELAAFDPDGTLLFNVNTPDDYTRSRLIARQG